MFTHGKHVAVVGMLVELFVLNLDCVRVALFYDENFAVDVQRGNILGHRDNSVNDFTSVYCRCALVDTEFCQRKRRSACHDFVAVAHACARCGYRYVKRAVDFFARGKHACAESYRCAALSDCRDDTVFVNGCHRIVRA